MKSLVFYSWQSDLPNSTNRGFIETALERAAKTIRNDDSIEVEPVVDRDTVGVPGAPEIASTIFAKIEKADVFVCDVSLINEGVQTRPTPNPNVLLELGFAMKALGWDRIVMVLNTAFGKPELLPFDLRMRRVITYDMREDCADRAAERKVLESKVEFALRTIFEHKQKEAPGEQIQPVRVLAQALDAVQTNKLNVAPLVRRYMNALVAELSQDAPKYAEGREQGNEPEELLIESLGRTVGKVDEFCKLAESIASMNSVEGATALYKSFEIILSRYNAPRNSTSYDDRDGDFYKFLGYELFTSFISFLIREGLWELIGKLLEQNLYLENPEEGHPTTVSFEYVNKHIELIELWNKRLSPRKVSPQGDLLRSRLTEARPDSSINFESFMEADFLLYLRSFFRGADEWERWFPSTAVYMRAEPRFIVEATAKMNAEQLLRPLGIKNPDEFRSRFLDAAKWVNGQLGRRRGSPGSFGKWWQFKAESFGSR